MFRNLWVCLIAVWMLSTNIFTFAQNATITLRVLDQTEIAGIPGAIVLVNPGKNSQSKAFITDDNGIVSLTGLSCATCLVTVMDPSGIFLNQTTVLDRKRSFIAIILPVRPNYNMVDDPAEVPITITVYDVSKMPVVNSEVLIRPREIILTPKANWFTRISTDSNGQVKIRILPGEYTLASFMNEKLFESPFSVACEIDEKCTSEKMRCMRSSAKKFNIKKPIVLSLTEKKYSLQEKPTDIH
jgi:hypothetical protein